MAEKKQLGIGIGLAAVVVIVAGFFVREVLNEGALGESRNPNFGHPTANKSAHGAVGANSIRDMTEDQYYQALKINRPDLNEKQLREKSDHWWKVKMGEAHPSGG